MRGSDFNGPSGGAAAAPAGDQGAGGAGINDVVADKPEKLALKVGQKGKEQELEPAADGRFRLKVGGSLFRSLALSVRVCSPVCLIVLCV